MDTDERLWEGMRHGNEEMFLELYNRYYHTLLFIGVKEIADFHLVKDEGKNTGDLLKLFCDEMQTCYFENTGNGKFIKHVLPIEAQFAPVNAILCEDFDKDGIKDILLAGNEYQAEVMRGRYDASYGCFLKGMGNNGFKAILPVKSGFIVDGDVKDMKLISNKEGNANLVLVAVNNDSLKVFSLQQ